MNKPVKKPLNNPDRVVQSLCRCLSHGGRWLEMLPDLAKEVCAPNPEDPEGRPIWKWRVMNDPLRTVVEHDTFAAFCEHKPLEGLGVSVDDLKNLCHDRVDVLDAIDEACRRGDGRPTKTLYNVQDCFDEKAPTGNTKTSALRRLRKDRLDLHSQVIAGAISVHAAMVEAGFRHRTVTVPADNAQKAVMVLLKHYTHEEILAVMR